MHCYTENQRFQLFLTTGDRGYTHYILKTIVTAFVSLQLTPFQFSIHGILHCVNTLLSCEMREFLSGQELTCRLGVGIGENALLY